MRFSPCIDALYFEKDDVTIEQRIRQIKQAGFTHYEFWSWWDKDIDLIESLNRELGLEISTMCTKFVSLVDKDCFDAYYKGLKQSIECAKRLGVKRLISQTGDEIIGLDRKTQKQNMMDGLKKCAPLLEENDIVLMVEPLNLLVDHAGYFLSKSFEANEIINGVDSPNVKMLLDIYHQQITEGNLISNIIKYHENIAHYHVADNPGRKEPGTGEINFQNVFNAIKQTGFNGFLGLEFFPKEDVADKLLNIKKEFQI